MVTVDIDGTFKLEKSSATARGAVAVLLISLGASPATAGPPLPIIEDIEMKVGPALDRDGLDGEGYDVAITASLRLAATPEGLRIGAKATCQLPKPNNNRKEIADPQEVMPLAVAGEYSAGFLFFGASRFLAARPKQCELSLWISVGGKRGKGLGTFCLHPDGESSRFAEGRCR